MPSLQQFNLLPDLRYSGMVGLAGSSPDCIPNHYLSQYGPLSYQNAELTALIGFTEYRSERSQW